ncbi:MAG: hypothetical protein J6H31_16535 [Butyrivibrio sp.]|nr:hypothetical protein [Butyrivibrio sp.]
MQDIIIVCAGNRARSVYTNLMLANRLAEEKHEECPYNVLGFINDIPNTLKDSGINAPILGTIVDWHPKGNERYIMGTADPKGKEKLAKMLKERGCRFISFISPNAVVSPDLEMGEGCVVEAYRIAYGVKLGDFVSVNASMLMSGARVDDFSTTTGFTVIENASVGKRVYIGSHAVVTEGIHVGDDARIGIGSIVVKDIQNGATVFGVPAEVTGW